MLWRHTQYPSLNSIPNSNHSFIHPWSSSRQTGYFLTSHTLHRRSTERLEFHADSTCHVLTCTGCSPCEVLPIPSTVTTAAPSTEHRGVRQAFTATWLHEVGQQRQQSNGVARRRNSLSMAGMLTGWVPAQKSWRNQGQRVRLLEKSVHHVYQRPSDIPFHQLPSIWIVNLVITTIRWWERED